MPSDDQKNPDQKVLEILQAAMAQDEELRSKYQVGDKFRFVRDRLRSTLEQLEGVVQQSNLAIEKADRKITAEEVAVYVYLYNAHGVNLRSWQNMLTPKVFYEYSVNRPIYAEKAQIESLLRSKTNKLQHGYLEVIVRADDIIRSETNLKDFAGNPVIKVKEGALRFANLLDFIHNGYSYSVTTEGELVRKIS